MHLRPPVRPIRTTLFFRWAVACPNPVGTFWQCTCPTPWKITATCRRYVHYVRNRIESTRCRHCQCSHRAQSMTVQCLLHSRMCCTVAPSISLHSADHVCRAALLPRVHRKYLFFISFFRNCPLSVPCPLNPARLFGVITSLQQSAGEVLC